MTVKKLTPDSPELQYVRKHTHIIAEMIGEYIANQQLDSNTANNAIAKAAAMVTGNMLIACGDATTENALNIVRVFGHAMKLTLVGDEHYKMQVKVAEIKGH